MKCKIKSQEKICENCKYSYQDDIAKSIDSVLCKFEDKDTYFQKYHKCHNPEKFEEKIME